MKYDTDQIEKYIAGKLSGAEVKAFEQRLKEDKDFAYEVRLHQTAIETVQYASFMKRVEKVREDIAEEETPVIPIQSNRRKNMRWILAIAASLLIIPLLYFLIIGKGGDTNQLMADIEKELSPFKTTMGESNPDETLEIIAKKLYIPVKPIDSLLIAFPTNTKPNAILEQLAQEKRNLDIVAAYKQGVYHFERKKYEKAHYYFDLLIANGKRKRPEATFYKAYSYFKENKIEEAKQQFQKILTDDQATTGLKKRVREILASMNS